VSHETVRDLRQDQAAGAPRVRGPVRDRVSTEPQPDQGGGGASARRPLLWRIAATVFLGLVLVGVGLLVGSDDPAPDCAVLHRQAAYSSDAATLLTEAGCGDLDPTVRP
jgi:hypothetical protein